MVSILHILIIVFHNNIEFDDSKGSDKERKKENKAIHLFV